MAALPQTDIVINCLPGSAEGFFSADLVAAMAPDSIYASVGRCNTTDEPALIAALEAGHLGGAVLDVTAIEPLPTDNPLWALPNVLLTQHTGGSQHHGGRRQSKCAVAQPKPPAHRPPARKPGGAEPRVLNPARLADPYDPRAHKKARPMWPGFLVRAG